MLPPPTTMIKFVPAYNNNAASPLWSRVKSVTFGIKSSLENKGSSNKTVNIRNNYTSIVLSDQDEIFTPPPPSASLRHLSVGSARKHWTRFEAQTYCDIHWYRKVFIILNLNWTKTRRQTNKKTNTKDKK